MGIKNKKALLLMSTISISSLFLSSSLGDSFKNGVKEIKESVSHKNEEILKQVKEGNSYKTNKVTNKETLQKVTEKTPLNQIVALNTDSKKQEDKEPDTQVINYNNEKVNYKENIKIDGVVSQDLIELLNTELNKIPEPIVSKYFADGGKLILTSYDIATTYYNDHVIGSLMELYDDRAKILYVSARNNAIKQGAIHGFGHAFDSMTGWKSTTTSHFSNIFEEEKNTIKTVDGGDYHKSSKKEYFAEAFYSFMVNPTVTEKTAPQTVNFIRMLMCDI